MLVGVCMYVGLLVCLFARWFFLESYNLANKVHLGNYIGTL